MLMISTIIYAQEPQFAVVRPDGTTIICPSWDSAYKKSTTGDKIYLPKGTFNTSSTPINKTLHLIGVGINEDSSQTIGITVVDNIDLYTFSSNSTIENIKVNGGIRGHGLTSGDTIINIKLRNIEINGPISHYGAIGSVIFSKMAIVNSIIRNIEGILENSIISNCVMLGNYSFGGKNNLFSNNIFFQPQTGQLYIASFSIIKNNIFQNEMVTTQNSTIQNNFGQFFNHTYFNNIVSNHLGFKCFNDIFISSGETPWPCYFSYSRNNNYRLKPTSGGKNSGTDGTDVGLYGGLFPWDDSGQYSTPVIYHKKVGPNSTSDGKLKVEYKVRAGN